MSHTPTTRYRDWMAAASAADKRRVAEIAGLRYDYVAYQLGRPYMPPPGVVTAVKLEDALAEVGAGRGELPRVDRADIAPTCAECPHAQHYLRTRGDAPAPAGCPSSRTADLTEDEEHA